MSIVVQAMTENEILSREEEEEKESHTIVKQSDNKKIWSIE